jgi:hypothetical protein
MKNIISLFKNASMEKKLFALVIAVYLAASIFLISALKQVPGPLYGGDLYYQLGSIYHVANNAPSMWFKSSNVNGSLPNNMPIYAIFVALFVWLGLNEFSAMLIAGTVLVPAVLILLYYILSRVFHSEQVALLGSMLFATLTSFPIIKYTQFTQLIFAPLFFYSLYLFFKEKSIRNAVVLGIVMGVFGLSHQVGFIASSLMLFCMCLYFIIIEPVRKKTIKSEVKRSVLPIALCLIIFLSISMLYWFKPIFVYHGKTLNSDQDYQFNFGSFGYQINYAFNTLKETFFNLSSVYSFILSLLALLGTFLLFTNFNKSFENKFMLLYFLFSIAIVFHYFLTEPVIKTNLVPGHLRMFLLSFASLLPAAISLKFLLAKAGKWRSIAFVAVIALLFLNSAAMYRARESDRWTTAGKQPIPENIRSIQAYLLANTSINDVILSSNEVSFSLNGISGRKAVLFRRAHNDKFLNFDDNELDGAIILYGNDSAKAVELMKKYNVKYLYWDYYWINSEYSFNETGHIVSWYDPITIRYSQYYENELKKYNISYFIQNTWLDPAMNGPDVKKMDIIFVSPGNYRAFEMPWHSRLDQYLSPVWSYSANNQTVAVLYRVTLP